MIRWYYKHKIGTVTSKVGNGNYARTNIFGGNVLCAFTCFYKDEEGKKMERFLNCYFDEAQIKRIMKEKGKIEPILDITSIRLNTYYKEGMVLAKYFAKSGYKVNLYYKEPKK